MEFFFLFQLTVDYIYILIFNTTEIKGSDPKRNRMRRNTYSDITAQKMFIIKLNYLFVREEYKKTAVCKLFKRNFDIICVRKNDFRQELELCKETLELGLLQSHM